MTLNIVAWPGLKEKGANPYTWLVYQPMAAMGANVMDFSFYKPMPAAADVLHVHWPEGIFWNRFSRKFPWLGRVYAERLMTAISHVKRNGGILVWTSHNLQPHEPLHPVHERIWEDFFPRFRSLADLVICLTPEAERLLKDSYPDMENKRITVIPHPHYRTAYSPPLPMQDARGSLDIAQNDFVLCCAGGIRPSKGIAEFAECFAGIAGHDEKLIIAGACDDDDYTLKLQSIAHANSSAIDLRFGRLSDEAMIALLSAADLTAVNFRSILNSGSVLLSLSCNTPVCVPASGSLLNLSRQLGDDWVMHIPQPLSGVELRKVIDQARIRATKRKSPIAPLPTEWEPDAVSSRTLDEYKNAIKDYQANRGLITQTG